jgi:hypothetical protein
LIRATNEKPRLVEQPGFSSVCLREVILPNSGVPECACGDDADSLVRPACLQISSFQPDADTFWAAMLTVEPVSYEKAQKENSKGKGQKSKSRGRDLEVNYMKMKITYLKMNLTLSERSNVQVCSGGPLRRSRRLPYPVHFA